MKRDDEISLWLKNISYRNWTFNIVDDHGLFLQLSFEADCACGNESKMIHFCRKWRISERMTKSEFVQMAFTAVMAANEHEVREEFKYKSSAVYSPHFDVDELERLYVGKKWDMRINSKKLDNS